MEIEWGFDYLMQVVREALEKGMETKDLNLEKFLKDKGFKFKTSLDAIDGELSVDTYDNSPTVFMPSFASKEKTKIVCAMALSVCMCKFLLAENLKNPRENEIVTEDVLDLIPEMWLKPDSSRFKEPLVRTFFSLILPIKLMEEIVKKSQKKAKKSEISVGNIAIDEMSLKKAGIPDRIFKLLSGLHNQFH